MMLPRFHRSQHGFSLIELLVTIAILGILAAVAAPNLKAWSRGYYLKSASTDLYSHMQMAKLGAVKDSQPWTVNFNPGGLRGYDIRNSAGTVIKSVDFRTQYSGDIQFNHPTSSVPFDNATLTFNPNGITDQGFSYISDTHRTGYYRIGLPLPNGTIRVQKWNGSAWN